MNHEHEQDRVLVRATAIHHNDTIEPGQSSRSALLDRPAHPVASGLVQRRASAAGEAEPSAVHAAAAQGVATASSQPSYLEWSDQESDPAPARSDVTPGAKVDAPGTIGQETHAPGGCQTLPSRLRTHMERAFNASFADILVIPSSPLASSMGAHAIADGNELHFATGMYDPSSKPGVELIGHELAHVLQQRANVATHAHGGINDPLEHEADDQGARAARGEQARISRPSFDHPDSPVQIRTDTATSRRRQAKFAVQIEQDREDCIQSIHFSGRTESPFKKSMGAHTTAWVVHCDHVRAVLLRLTLRKAVINLSLLADELDQIAAWTWNSQDTGADADVDRQRFLKSRRAITEGLTNFNNADRASQVSIIQRAIASYLEARNFLPMATVDNKKTKGNSEGISRAKMPELGGSGGVDEAWSLFDFQACMSGAESPISPSVGKLSPLDRIAQAIAGHAVAIRSAYPKIYENDDKFLHHGIELLTNLDNSFNKETLFEKAKKCIINVSQIQRTADESLEGTGSQSVAAELVVSDGKLEEINAGRALSPFKGTQGAHITAWVVHEDALNSTMGVGDGISLEDSARRLLDAISEFEQSPLAEWIPQLPLSIEDARNNEPRTGGEEYHSAKTSLEEAKGVLSKAVESKSVKLGDIQVTAQRLLQLQNLFPLATTKTGHTNPGNRERSLRKLNGKAFEQAVWHNFDLESLDVSAQDRHSRKREWDQRLRGVDPTSSYELRIAMALAQHLFYARVANSEEFKKVEWEKSCRRYLEEEGMLGSGVIAALACKKAGLPYSELREENENDALVSRSDVEDDYADYADQSFDYTSADAEKVAQERMNDASDNEDEAGDSEASSGEDEAIASEDETSDIDAAPAQGVVSPSKRTASTHNDISEGEVLDLRDGLSDTEANEDSRTNHLVINVRTAKIPDLLKLPGIGKVYSRSLYSYVRSRKDKLSLEDIHKWLSVRRADKAKPHVVI